MRIVNFIGVLICCLSTCVIGEPLKSIDVAWEKGTDLAVTQVIGIHPNNGHLLYIRKTYLSSFRNKRFPEKSQIEQYDIVEAQSGKVVPFLSANIDEKVTIGRSIWNGTTFIIPLIKSYKAIELHFYDPKSATMKKTMKMPHKYNRVSGVYATTNGYVTTHSQYAYSYANFDSYKQGGTSISLPVVPQSGHGRRILDITERDNRVYMVLTGKNKDYGAAVWLYSFNKNNVLETSSYERLSTFDATITNVKFIPSTTAIPSMWVGQQHDYNDPPKITIVRAGDTQTALWEKKMANWLEWTESSLFDFGGNNFLRSKRTRVTSEKKVVTCIGALMPHTQGCVEAVTFESIGKQQKNAELTIPNEELNTGIFTDVDFYPSQNGFYTIMTHLSGVSGSQYSWHGYKIKKVKLDTKLSQ